MSHIWSCLMLIKLPNTQVWDQERPDPWGRLWGREPRGPFQCLGGFKQRDSLVLKMMPRQEEASSLRQEKGEPFWGQAPRAVCLKKIRWNTWTPAAFTKCTFRFWGRGRLCGGERNCVGFECGCRSRLYIKDMLLNIQGFFFHFFLSPTVIPCLITHHANVILTHFLMLLFP